MHITETSLTENVKLQLVEFNRTGQKEKDEERITNEVRKEVRGGINGSRGVVCIKMERYLYLLRQHDRRFQKYRLLQGKAFCLYSSGRQHLGPVRNHWRNDTNINPPTATFRDKLPMNWSGMTPSHLQ